MVHHVVCHQEKRLQPLDAPSNSHCQERLLLADRSVAQGAHT
jgi:hypothetical protein